MQYVFDDVSPQNLERFGDSSEDNDNKYAETNYIYDIAQNQRNVYAADTTFEVDEPLMHAYAMPDFGTPPLLPCLSRSYTIIVMNDLFREVYQLTTEGLFWAFGAV